MNQSIRLHFSKSLVVAFAVVLTIGGCADMSPTQRGTATGAGVGAGLGALIGGTTGGGGGNRTAGGRYWAVPQAL